MQIFTLTEGFKQFVILTVLLNTLYSVPQIFSWYKFVSSNGSRGFFITILELVKWMHLVLDVFIDIILAFMNLFCWVFMTDAGPIDYWSLKVTLSFVVIESVAIGIQWLYWKWLCNIKAKF